MSIPSTDEFSSLPAWRDWVNGTMFSVDIDADAHVDFYSKSTSTSVSSALLIRTSQSPRQTYTRTKSAIASDCCDDVVIAACLGGTQEVSQLNRRIVARPGDCFLLDVAEAYEWRCEDHKDALFLQIPRQVVDAHFANTKRLPLEILDGKQGWGAVLFSLLLAMQEIGEKVTVPPSVILHQALEMFASAIDLSRFEAVPYRDALWSRITSTIRARCTEENLKPEDVAREMQISTRTLFRTLAACQTTFSSVLFGARLDAARSWLGSSDYRHMPIGDIAAHAGFADPSHFARKFRALEGVSPAQYRMQRAGSG